MTTAFMTNELRISESFIRKYDQKLVFAPGEAFDSVPNISENSRLIHSSKLWNGTKKLSFLQL